MDCKQEYTVFVRNQRGEDCYSSGRGAAPKTLQALIDWVPLNVSAPFAWAPEHTAFSTGTKSFDELLGESLAAGRLIEKTHSGWVALGAAVQEERVESLGALLQRALDRGIGKAVARPGFTYVATVPAGLSVTPADLAMVDRDGPAKRIMPAIFGIDYAAGCAPSTAKPNPFQNYTAPDCSSVPDHLNASRHQMAGMKG